jgi:HEAT repeat protein
MDIIGRVNGRLSRFAVILAMAGALVVCSTERSGRDGGQGSGRPVAVATQTPQAGKSQARARQAVRFLGRPAAYWGRQLRNPDRKIRGLAAAALRLIGPDAAAALPEMAAALADKDVPIDWTLVCTLGDFRTSRPEAAAALVAALHEHRGDPAWYSILGTAAKLGPDSVPLLADLLRDPDPAVRRMTAAYLATIGPGAKAALPEPVSALTDSDEAIRVHAAGTIQRIAPDREIAARISILTRGLASKVHGIPGASAEYLGEIGPPARSALPALEAARTGPDSTLRWQAAEAIVMIEKSTVAELSDALKSPDVNVVRGAARKLGEMGPAAREAIPALAAAIGKDWNNPSQAGIALEKIGEPAVPALIKVLEEDKKGGGRRSAALALARIGPAAAPYLAAALGNADPQVRLHAAMGLALMESVPKEALPELLRGLGDPERQVRHWSIRALQKLSPPPPEIVPALTVALADDDWTVRLAAVDIMGRMGPDAPGAAAPLANVLRGDRDEDVRVWAALALGRVDPRGTVSVPALTGALNQSLPVRIAAIHALSELGPAAKPAVPALAKSLHESGPEDQPFWPSGKSGGLFVVEEWKEPFALYGGSVGFAAAVALGSIGDEAVPALVGAVRAESGPVKCWSIWALGKTGPAAGAAVPELERALADEDPAVRREAAAALGEIRRPGDPTRPPEA